MILFKFPKMDGKFYQDKIEAIMKFLNEDISSINYNNFEKELFL